MLLIDRILKRINIQERGWVFCAKDFSDFSSRNNIDKMLSILAFDKKIMRLARGIYYFPELNNKQKPLPPTKLMVAKAIANNFNFKIFPSGQRALRMIGFPIKESDPNIFWTNAKTTKKRVGADQFIFKHKKIVPFAKTPEAIIVVLCAIIEVGKDNIDEFLIKRCHSYLTKEERPHLLQMASRVPVWVSMAISKILEFDNKNA